MNKRKTTDSPTVDALLNLEHRANDMLDDVIAMQFTFLTLARALHERGVLPLESLAGRLREGAEDLRVHGLPDYRTDRDLFPIAARLDSLHDAVLQLQSLAEERSS